jgi:uncharacterized protein YdeI (YjbR/CyaY-like superfamily)
MEAVFFADSAEFRTWLALHHATEREVVVGFYKKDSGLPSVTYSEALDEALCFGWIDGIRRAIDAVSFSNRFTPRRHSSNWSNVNVARVRALVAQGRMEPSGMKAFEERDPAREGVYSFENAPSFDRAQESLFEANAAAWEFFQRQPPGYRRTATSWVVSAKREATRLSRLHLLIADSAGGRRLGIVSGRRTPDPIV